MYALFFVLLRILFPLDPVARLREVTRDYLGELIGYLEDPLGLEELQTDPFARASLEAEIAVAEHGVQLLIHERARQIAGQPFVFTSRMQMPALRRARSLREILARLSRLVALFDRLESLAARRAERMQEEATANPSDLINSMMMILNRDDDRAIIIIMLEVLHRRRRGRWIGATSRRDGGGCASPRGPPPDRCSEINRLTRLAPTCEIARACPIKKKPPHSHDATPHSR